MKLTNRNPKPRKNIPSYLAYHPSKKSRSRILVMVGGGRTTGPHCGQVKFGIRCVNPSCSQPHQSLATYSCNRLSCPVCRDAAISRLARRVTDRVEGMQQAYKAERMPVGPISHVQISTDPTAPMMAEDVLGTADGYQRALRHVYNLLKCHVRNYGGVLIFHPWRQVHLDGTECGRHDCNKPHKWEWSPHWHYLGWGYWRKSDQFYKLTGWTYSKLGQGVKQGLGDESKRSVYNTVHYQLTHMGIFMDKHGMRQDGQSVRYVGMLSNSKGGYRREGYIVTTAACEACGEGLREYSVIVDLRKDKVLFLSDLGPHMQQEERKVWYINRTKSRLR